MTALARITIYPIKSLDGVDLSEVAVLPSGGLANDRRWALVDADGQFVNGKRTAAIHAIRAEFTPDLHTVKLSRPSHQPAAFQFATQLSAMGEWLSEAIQIQCTLIESSATGFPDDLDAPGPTLISTGTLAEVARWFALSPEEVFRRFRANLTIDTDEPFWEDRLIGTVGSPQPFSLGTVHWLGVNPCQRCVVPSRDSHSGDGTERFQREFAARRKATLPAWAPRARFDHFYRMSVNTQLAEDSPDARLSIGDELQHLAK